MLLAAVCLVAGWQQPADPRVQIRALAETGHLADAEKMARDAGPAMSAALGEVLVLRGKLSGADSAFHIALDKDVAGRRTADAALAELALERGDRAEAFRRASALTSSYENPANRWSPDDRVAAGRAYVVLGKRNATSVRRALAAFDAAVASDQSNLEARLRVGDLFLDKYNAPDARKSYEDVIQHDPDNARALLGLANVARFEGKPEAMTLARRAVTANPALVDGQLFLARAHVEAEVYDSATTDIHRALAVDSSSMYAWSLLGATAWITGDSAEFNRAQAAAKRLNAHPSDFYAELSDAAVRLHRYDDGRRLANEALAMDSNSVRALGLVGTNELRAAKIAEGRATIERAFAIDPFNLWHKNTLDLLDNLAKFKTVDRGRFRIVAPQKEAEILSMYLQPLLEEAFDTLSAKYGYTPPTPVRLEIYGEHADFSVRTVGLTGLGALGVSFGPVLAMDAPSSRPRGEFNWGSTAWHELAHTFTLGVSSNRVPRWFTEGLSVLEERHARAGWGASASVEFLSAYLGGRIRPVSQLNDGFVHPRYNAEIIHSYYDASLVCEMIESTKGRSAIVAMLKAYRDGQETPAVFERVLGVKPADFDIQFDAWLRAKFAVPMRSILPDSTGKGEPGGAFVDAIRAGTEYLRAGRTDSARATLLRAQAMFPDYAGNAAPAIFLSQLARDRGDLKEALEQITHYTSRSESSWEGNLLEADIREKMGDSAGARAPLERMIWISPYDVGVHVRLAALAARAADYKVAIRERRAVVALDPMDALDAHYQLAKALSDSGDVAGARRELLGVLEQAPSFEKAQLLLLELKNRNPR
jgi:tetratricopeptide (TPR) repeat protein